MNAQRHEIVSAFHQVGLDLHKTLCEMLDEHSSHRTERRGCGYTQATRLLSTHINQPRSVEDASDLGIFADWPKQATESLARQAITAGWSLGWRNLDRCETKIAQNLLPATLAESLHGLPQKLAAIEQGLEREESRLLMAMIRQTLTLSPTATPSMPAMSVKPDIGSCSQAEEFFLEIAHGRIRRGGKVNIFVDDAGQPLLVEKMALGESHSAMAVAPVAICDVALPPGSLFALQYDDDAPAMREIACGRVLALSAIQRARFLRLTTLAVSPIMRQRAFSSQFEAQIRGDMLSPKTTTINHLHDFAHARLCDS